jgi:hypothetical protein
LDEILISADHTFDEVHHSDRLHPKAQTSGAMYLETLDRRSLFHDRPPPGKSRSLLRSGKRPARTPPSTFLFLPIHLSNSPEAWRLPTPRTSQEADEA